MISIDSITGDYRSNCTGLVEIPVADWDGSVWFKPITVMNMVQRDRYENTIKGADVDSYVNALILRSRKEDGTKMFVSSNKNELMNSARPKVIQYVVDEMLRIDKEESEAEKKGSTPED